MAKGMFTQGVCLLTNGQATIDVVRIALEESGFEIVKELPTQENHAFGGPTVVIPYLPNVNGYAAVDVVNEPWPDSMGDPKSDVTTLGAWSMGFYGPFAFPGGLARVRQHSWSWPAGKTAPEGHRGFVRIRISYAFGASKDSPVFPADCDPVAEMMFLSRVVIATLKVPGIICYFNPNGEVLRDSASFLPTWDACFEQQKLPLLLWMNIRFFNLNDRLGFMDTVGNAQLDIRDIEAIFPKGKYDPRDIDHYLRNVSHYLLDLGREMKTGESIDGPGESNLTWTIEVIDHGAVEPPRRMLRLYPKAIGMEVRDSLSAITRSPE